MFKKTATVFAFPQFLSETSCEGWEMDPC